MDQNHLVCGVCAVVRLENNYLNEWVQHYKKLGFDKIILFDNNRYNEDKVNDVINDDIKTGFVNVIKVPTLTEFQINAYNTVIQNFGNQFNWVGFFDIDEYLTLTKHKTIQEYITETFDNTVDTIAFNWMVYGDNDLVYYEDKPIQERFLTPIDFDNCVDYDFPENDHIKTMVNIRLNNRVRFKNTPHGCINALNARYADNTCNTNGFSPFNHTPVYDPAHLKHYCTKTIDEYYKFKQSRACPDKLWNPYTFERFFKYNKHTPEKDEYVDKLKKEGLIK